jgi:hypothetical protein
MNGYGFGDEKVLYEPFLTSLVDSSAWCILVTPLTVCAGVHAHSLVSCMCGSMLELGKLVDQLGWSDLILHICILSNLPSGTATWHQFALLVSVLMQ